MVHFVVFHYYLLMYQHGGFWIFHYYCISYFVQVHKELKDAMTQLDTIRYEVQSLSRLTPGQFTTKQNNPGNYKLSLQ
jgi:hypothetical protein